jgi:hypothetical protein
MALNDFTFCHNARTLIDGDRTAAIAVGNRNGNWIGADHGSASRDRCDRCRGMRASQSQQIVRRQMFGMIAKNAEIVGIADGKRGTSLAAGKWYEGPSEWQDGQIRHGRQQRRAPA